MAVTPGHHPIRRAGPIAQPDEGEIGDVRARLGSIPRYRPERMHSLCSAERRNHWPFLAGVVVTAIQLTSDDLGLEEASAAARPVSQRRRRPQLSEKYSARNLDFKRLRFVLLSS